MFNFGANWKTFLKNHFDQEVLEKGTKSLTSFLNLTDFKGKRFLDIGCGSGMFSYIAYQLGAKEVVSFDLDPDSVSCCESLAEKCGSPSHWRIYRGSILNPDFVENLGKFDIVYSWGVLHHTGAMWSAITAALQCVAPQGLLYIAIYNQADAMGFYPDGRFVSSKFWKIEKKLYYRLPCFFQSIIDYTIMTSLIIGALILLKNPYKMIKNHSKYRGMAWSTDIKDWLGGYPYEYASVSSIFNYIKPLGFSLENLHSHSSLLNNEFLFKRDA